MSLLAFTLIIFFFFFLYTAAYTFPLESLNCFPPTLSTLFLIPSFSCHPAVFPESSATTPFLIAPLSLIPHYFILLSLPSHPLVQSSSLTTGLYSLPYVVPYSSLLAAHPLVRTCRWCVYRDLRRHRVGVRDSGLRVLVVQASQGSPHLRLWQGS